MVYKSPPCIGTGGLKNLYFQYQQISDRFYFSEIDFDVSAESIIKDPDGASWAGGDFGTVSLPEIRKYSECNKVQDYETVGGIYNCQKLNQHVTATDVMVFDQSKKSPVRSIGLFELIQISELLSEISCALRGTYST